MRNAWMAGILVLSVNAFAEAPAMPKPATELTQAGAYFEGKWKCEGTQFASPMGPEHKYKSTSTFKWDLANFWLHLRGEEEKTKENPMPMQFECFSGYDATAKKIVRTDYMTGGTWANFTSSGWEGDNFVFTGDMVAMGKKMPVKHTIVKKSTTEFTSSLDVTGADGKAMKFFDEVCKKAGGKK